MKTVKMVVAASYFYSEIRAAMRQHWHNATMLAKGKITLEEIEDDCIGRCEVCSAIHPYEVMASNEGGCYFCPECVARWNTGAA